MIEKSIVKKTGTSNFYMCGVSIKGEEKEENQDAFKIGHNEENTIFYVIVADGLGSCKNSALGAKRVVDIVEEWVLNELPKYTKLSKNVASIFAKRLLEGWDSSFNFKEKYEFDTTVHYAIYYDGNVLLGGIGDGMLLSQIDKFECDENVSGVGYFSNVTNSISSQNAKELFDERIIDSTEYKGKLIIVIATDGIAEDIIPDKKKILPSYFYESIKKNDIHVLQNELMEWIVNWETDGHSDDKTIGIMVIDREGF